LTNGVGSERDEAVRRPHRRGTWSAGRCDDRPRPKPWERSFNFQWRAALWKL